MFRILVLLACLTLIQGRSFQKIGKAHVKKNKPINNKASDRVPASNTSTESHSDDEHSKRQVTNVHNIQLTRTNSSKKVSGTLGKYGAAVTMIGTGSISLSTTQLPAGSDTPDHTISVVNNTAGCSDCKTISIPSGQNNLPLPLDNILNQPQAQPPKQRTFDESQTNSRKTEREVPHSKPEAKVPHLMQETIHESQTNSRKTEREVPHSKPEAKVPHLMQEAIHESQTNSKKTQHELPHSKPAAKVPQLLQETAKVNSKQHSPAERQASSAPAAASAVRQEHKTAPHEQPAESRDQSHKSDKPKVVVHSIHTISTEEPQQVYQQLDPNAIGVTMQGPGTVDMTTYQPQITHDIVFDPNPPDPCPKNGCHAPKQGGKRHQK